MEISVVTELEELASASSVVSFIDLVDGIVMPRGLDDSNAQI